MMISYPADMLHLVYHLRAMMCLMQTMLFHIPTIFIFNIITSTLIVGFVNVVTHQMPQKNPCNSVGQWVLYILNLSFLFFSTSRCDGSECLTNRHTYTINDDDYLKHFHVFWFFTWKCPLYAQLLTKAYNPLNVFTHQKTFPANTFH